MRTYNVGSIYKVFALLIHLQASLEVCKLHNQLSTALLMQDTFLVSRWHMAVEAATTALGLPLLVQDPTCCREGETSPRVRVNFTQRLIRNSINRASIVVILMNHKIQRERASEKGCERPSSCSIPLYTVYYTVLLYIVCVLLVP